MRISPTVHPHACGEHVQIHSHVQSIVGSSPRMWGTPNSKSATIGLIAVHPHACGEHMVCGVWFGECIGSSPRMWGTLHRRREGIDNNRFIPTHVGNTKERRGLRMFPAVHPHACGEHGINLIWGEIPLGSSPRMWGTLVQEMTSRHKSRFIPTHVGNTTGSLYP